jgi:hypothetical protein
MAMGIIYRALWNGVQSFRMAIHGDQIIQRVIHKSPTRTEIINALIDRRSYSSYLEIGVRNPDDNFNRIPACKKVSVDPGIEFQGNPVSYALTSDVFFEFWFTNHPGETFDVIFIDGLHRAEQCWRDIENASSILAEGGVIVVHDVLPPSPAFARENFERDLLADTFWNGTTWKAFHRYQWEGCWESRIVDSDWGVGLIDARKPRTPQIHGNPFYEWESFQRFERESGKVLSWTETQVWLEN